MHSRSHSSGGASGEPGGKKLRSARRRPAPLRQWDATLLNSLPAHIAVLDAEGTIIAVNDQWTRFAEENGGGRMQNLGVGANYLDACEAAAPSEPAAAAAKSGIESVLNGTRDQFLMEYPCHSRTEQRWFALNVTRPKRAVGGAVVTHTNITALRRSEAALRSSEERLRMVADNLPDSAVYQYMGDGSGRGRFTYVSAGIEALTGVTPEEALQNPGSLYGIILPGHLQALVEHEARCIRELKDFAIEVPMRRRDGVVRWMRIRSRPRPLPEGGVAWEGVLVDITERKRTEDALQESETAYRTLFEAIDAGFCVIEMIFDESGRAVDYRFLRVNPAFEQQTGIKNAEGRTAREIAPGLEDYWFRLYGDVALTGQSIRFENAARELKRFFDVFAFRVGQPSDRHVGILFNDITDRKRADRAQRELLRQPQLALDAAQLGWWQYDPESGISQWDERYRELFGMEGYQGPNDEVLKRVHPEDLPDLWAAATAAMDPLQPRPFAAEYRIFCPDKSVRWIEAHGSCEFEGAGPARRPTNFVGTVQDITGRKEFQLHLERVVAERTAKLQELVGDLEHFSYSITHDMRAPLRAMMSFADVLKEMTANNPDPQQRDFLERISSAARRMDLLITDALNYSRIVRQQLPLEPVDLGRLLRGMLDSYPELQPDRAGITIQDPLPRVLGNEAALTQCFSNLLGNAVKFVQPGRRPEITIRASVAAGLARIWVEDHGIGISPDMLPKVFDMFSRGTRTHQGTGIGLALVRKVVQRMGGRVGVESEEGVGSRFWVELKEAV